MKWATIQADGRTHAGLVQENQVHLIAEADVAEILSDPAGAAGRCDLGR